MVRIPIFFAQAAPRSSARPRKRRRSCVRNAKPRSVRPSGARRRSGRRRKPKSARSRRNVRPRQRHVRHVRHVRHEVLQCSPVEVAVMFQEGRTKCRDGEDETNCTIGFVCV